MTDNPMNGTGAAPVLDFPMNMTGTMPETNDMDTAATLGVPVNDDGTINLADLDIDGFGAQMQQQTVRMDSLETLHSVWLYDDEADAKKRVDEDGRYSVYGVPSMRNNDADLYVYGQDYVRAAAPALADAPLTFCERYIETIDDPATKSEYRKALDTLMASGKDTKQDYYGLIGRFVRDDVRRNYQKQQERKKHAEKLRQEGIALIDDMLMGREQFDIDRINENEEMARLLATEDGKSRLKSMRRAAYAMQSVVMCAAANRYTDFTPSNALSAIDTASDWIADENGELDPVAAKLFASSIYKWAQELQETGRERGFDDRFRDSLGQIIGNIMEAGSYERNIESEYKKAEALKDYYHVFEIPEIQERQLKTNRKRYEIAKAKYEAIRPKLERRKLVQGYINQAVDQGRVLDDNAAWWEKVSAFTAASAPATMIYAAGGWTSLPLTLAASGVGSVVNYTNQNEMYASEGVAEFFTNQERLPDENEKIGIYARAAQDAGIDTLVEVLPGQAVGFPATRLIGWMSKGGGKVGGMARYAARLGEKKWGAVGINLVASFGEEAVFEPLAAGILKGTSDRFLEAAGVPNYQSRGWGIVTEELKETWKDPAQLGSILATVVLLGGGHLPETIKASKSLEQQSAEWALAGLSEEAVAQARLSSTPEETAARLYQAEMNSDPEAVARRIREQREKRGEQTDENLKRTGLRSKGDEAAALRATWKQLEERGLMPHVEAVPSVDGKEQYRLTERDAEGKEKVMLMDAAETDAYLTIRAQRVMELSIGTVQANVFGMQDEMLRGLYGEAAAAAIRRNADKTGVAIRDVSEVEGVTEDMVQEARNDREMSRMWLATAADRIGGVWKNISAAFTQRLALEGIDEGGTRAFRMQTQRESQMDGRKVFGSLVTYVNGGASVADLMEEALESHTDMTLQVRAAEIAEANKELTAQQAMEQALQEMADKVKPVIQAMAKMDYGANRAIKAMADERNWQGDNLRGTVIEAISHIQKSRLLANGDVLPAAWREGVAQAADALGFMDDIRRWGELYKQLKDSGTDVDSIEEYFAKQNAYARTVFEQARVDEQVIASWERAQQFQERKAAGEKGSGAVSATRAVEQAEKDEEEIRQREKAEAALPKLDEEEEAAQKEAYKVSAEQAARQTVELAAPNAPSALDGVFAGNVCTHNEEGGYYSGLVNVARLRDSKDVEQVKQGNKGKHGVINPLVGDYQKDAPPIFVWQRKNGALEVISGRHRYALALATGTTAIPAYVYAEDETHNLKWARLLDFENNMRDDQADELTAAIYVRETGFDDLTLTRKGLMRNGTKSRRGILIGREAREELWTRFRNRAVSPMDAEVIVNMTKNIKDTGRIEEIQRRCCMLLDERKSWEYIGAMVQLMANKESVFMKQGLLDLGADFEEDLARAAKYIETCTKQLNEAISVMKSGRKMSGKQADLARRLGQLTTSSEDSQQRLDALTTMKAMFDNIGMYPDLVAGAQMWDGKTEIDAVGMALERGMREAQENEAEDGMSVEEQLEQAEAEANRKAAEELTGSLFGGSFSVNLDDYFQPLQEGEADIPIEKLYTLKKEPRKSIDNAMRFMRMAARGEMDKRAAVSVVEHRDGTYTIADGNATSRALSEMGAKAVRVKVVGEDTGSRLYNSAYLVKDEMPGADADGKLRTHGLEALQGDAAVQRAFGQAEENLPILEKLVDAAAAKVGGEKMMRPANSENGLATKKPSTAIDKARRDYNGDISRVVDLIGGTVVMPSDGDFGDAVKAIRKSLPEGASIAKVKKLGFWDNAPRYKDVKVSVRFANGGIGEIILVEGRINDAKFNRGGHNIYDVKRELDPYTDSMPEADNAVKKLDELSSLVYAEGVDAATLERAKSSASSALEALQPSLKNLSLTSGVIGTIKSPDSLSKVIIPASVDSAATPRVSLIQNISESAIPQVDGKGKHIPQDGAKKADITFSVAEQKKMDAQYMAAVERGDMEEAARMVREYAAKREYLPQDTEYWMAHRPMRKGTEKKTTEERQRDGDALSILDLAKGVWNVPKDFFEHPEWYDTQPGSVAAAIAVRDAIERAKKWLAGELKTEPHLRCYRAVPNDVKEDTPRNGDWVTPSREYAEEHIQHSLDGKGRVQVFSAKVSELYFNGDSVMEFGYHDSNDYAYRNTKNNRKLLAPVTYENVEVRAEDGEFEGEELGEWNAETRRFDHVPYRYNVERRIVPLSKRFNSRSADVSFSVAEAKTRGLFKDGVMVANNYVVVSPEASFSITDLLHASPSQFRRFDHSKIGSGVGAQMMGYGTYLTNNKWDMQHYIGLMREREQTRETATAYKVTLLADEDDLLHWSKPLSEQSPMVQNVLQGYVDKLVADGNKWGEERLKGFAGLIYAETWRMYESRDGLSEFDAKKKLSLELLKQGVKGSVDKYGTYVIYDENDLEITEYDSGSGWRPIDTASFSVSPTLREDIEAASANKLKAKSIVSICSCPPVLVALGREKRDVVTMAHVIRKIATKHGMKPGEIERALNLLQDPEFVIQDSEGSFIFIPGVLAARKDGSMGDVEVPIKLEHTKNGEHYMLSLYPLDTLQNIESHLRQGRLVYSKNSKAALSSNYAPGLSPELMRLMVEHGFTDNTITRADIVKRESEDFSGRGGSYSVTSYAERQRAVREKMNEMALRDAQTNELIQELTTEGQDLRLGGKKSQQEALAALARVEALVNRTRAMLPPKLAKLGRLDKTLAWVRVYSDMVQSGEVKLNEKISSTAITQKFIEKMNKSRDEALLHGLSAEEAQDVLRNIGAERLGESLARVTDFCNARLTALLKSRSLDAIMAMARRITWQMQDNTMQDLEQMEAELRDSLMQAGENVDLQQAERVLKRIERKRLGLLKRMVEEAYKNAFPKKEPGQRTPRGKMDAESYRMLIKMHAAMSMTAEQVNERQTEIEALLGKLEETAPDYEEKRERLEDEMMLLGAFGNWEGMDVGKAADAAKQFLEFVQTRRTEWQAKLEDEKQYYAYLRELMSANFSIPDNPNTRSAGKQAQGVKRSTQQTFEHVAVNLMNYGQLMRSAAPKLGQQFTMERRNEIANANAGLANDNRAFETAFYHFVAEACGSAKEADCIKWLNKFAEVTTKSGVIVQEGKVGNLVMDTEEARKWVAMSKEEREQKREEIAKADAVRMRKTLDIPTEEDIPALQAELLNMDSRMRILKNGTEVPAPSMASKVKVRRQGRRDMVELRMSRDQALNLILILEQEDYRHLISHWGFIPVDSMGDEVYNPDNLEAIDVRKSLASLYKFVGEDGLKLGYRMREYVGENGKRLAKCFEEYNGVPLNMREKYWKGNFNISPLKEKDQLTDAGSMACSGYSFMIDRVLHFNREELTNSATLIFGQTMQEQLNYIHTAHITRLWRRLLQDAEFANLMRANMGEDWMRGIKTWINVIDKANGAGELNMWRMTKLQSALMRGAAVAALSGNIQTIVKQSSAVIHAVLGGEVPYKVVSKGGGAVEFAWRGLGIGQWVSSMGHVLAGRGKVSAAAVRTSEWYQARIDSDRKNIAARMGLAAGEVQHAYTGRIAEKGMELMETVDRWSNLVSCVALADAVYRQMEKQNTQNKLGMSAEQMEREALQAVGRMLNEVAQPKMATQKTLATAAKPYGVSLGGFLTMFRSEMLNKLGMLCARAMEGEFAAGLGNYLAFGAFNAAVSMLLAYIRFGGGKDDKDEWWRTLAAFGYESMFADMYAIPIVGDALKYGESKLTGKYFHDAGVFGVFGIDRASKGLESLYEAAEGEKDLTAQQYAKHTQNVLRTTSLVMQAGRAFGLQNTWFGTVMEGVLDAATTANVVRTVTDVAERVKK